ncbi:MAG: hypothetical protein IT448_04570 [Phycisphaerales bacterium]|nr:hypothetical protein [Phycisphaerales bacterium]
MILSLKSKLVLVSAVASVSAALLSGMAGCDAVESSQGQANRKVAAATEQATRDLSRGDSQAAARVLGAVDDAAGASAKAQAYAVLAETGLSQAQPILTELEENYIRAAGISWDIDQSLAQLKAVTELTQILSQQDSRDVQAEVAKSVKNIQGDADAKNWVSYNDDAASVPTLTSVNQRISQLQGEIAKRKEKISQLADQRKKLGEQAQALVDKANQTPGQAGVDTFRNATQIRQQASVVGIEIDTINTQLIPLNNDLAVANAQREVLQRAVTRVGEIGNAQTQQQVAVNQQVAGQNQLAQQILQAGTTGQGAGDLDAKSQSIQAKMAELTTMLKEAGSLSEKANQLLVEAAKDAASAAQNALTLGPTLQTKGREQQASKAAFDAIQKTIDPNSYRLQELNIRQILASNLAHRADALNSAVQLQGRLQTIAQSAKLTLPSGLIDAQLSTELSEARGAANQAFQEAAELAQSIAEAGSATADQKNSARIAGALVRYSWAISARSANDIQTADVQLTAAKEAIGQAMAGNASLPMLPSELKVSKPDVATDAPAGGGF